MSASECNLMGGTFAMLVQVVLFAVVLAALLLKRNKEHPRRPLNIWVLDVAKQIVGGGLAHTINIFIATILRKRTQGKGKTDECVWYFINFFLDTSKISMFMLHNEHLHLCTPPPPSPNKGQA